jgi:hypothetical protein
MPVAYQFANATNTIPLSQLDANFASPITLGNTSIQLGNSVSTLNNMTLANVTISSGNIAFAIPATSGGTGLVSPGTTGNVLTSNGTAWVSTGVAAGSGVTALSFGSTGLTPSTSTSGNVTVAGTLAAGSGGTGLSSPGTTGNVLTSNGSAWVSSAAAGGGSAMTLISTQTASNSASLSWTGLSGYKKYMLIFQNIIPVSTTNQLYCQLGTGSGPTYITSGYVEALVFSRSDNSGTGGNGVGGGNWILTASTYVNNGSNNGTSGVVFIESALGGGYACMNYQSWSYNGGGVWYAETGSGTVTDASAKTAIQLFMLSGNINTGSASLYGISS